MMKGVLEPGGFLDYDILWRISLIFLARRAASTSLERALISAGQVEM